MLARWQFATTTVYHFLIVPLSIGLTVLVAVMQTLAYRKRGTPAGEMWDRSTRFWGRIMLVLFALGVVTGIVQEFQFGMNWSKYSRFVGDVFGAPLAMEGLIAFFLESTFLGLWIFGRNILSPKVHLWTIWLAAIGTNVSAYFILAANSFMQHPWGVHYNPDTNRIELTSIWKVLTNSTQLVTFPHTLFAAFMTASALLVTVSAWHLRKSKEAADPVHKAVAKMGIGVLIVSAVGVSLVGHVQGQIMTDQQPMKMAAAEALWHTEKSADFSLFAYAPLDEGTKGDNSENKFNITIPSGLSILAKNRPGATVQGIDEVGKAEATKYAATTGLTEPAAYVPVVWLAYWMFRLMIGLGVLAALIGLFFAIQWRRGKLTRSDRLLRVATWTVALPLLANTAGWLFTETARQPWLVYGYLTTSDGVSTNVGSGLVLTTLVLFTAVYGVLGVICFRIVRRIAMAGPDASAPPTAAESSDEPVMSLV
jgi:cytochrome d ubiquinol oxidase subunit I